MYRTTSLRPTHSFSRSETGLVIAGDPFFDPPEPQLIGVGHIYLESLAYLLDIKQSTPVVDYRGNKVAGLTVDIAPCDAVGQPAADVVDAPEELVGRRFDLLVRVEAVSGLSKQFARHGTSVSHKFWLDDEAISEERLSAVAPPSANPSFNYERHITVDPVTEAFVQYLREGSMTFELVSQPADDPAPIDSPAVDADVDGKVPALPLSGVGDPAMAALGTAAAAGPEETPRVTRLERQLVTVTAEMEATKAERAALVAEVEQQRSMAAASKAELVQVRLRLEEERAKKKSSTCVVS